MHTIAVCNLKGGVGKTTTTFNLAAALARLGHRVLVIDADGQCSLSAAFGADEFVRQGPTLAEVLRGQATVGTSAVQTRVENVWLVPASPVLDEINRRNLAGERVLLARLTEACDYTLIDCPASAGVVLANAFVAADEVLAPVQAQGMALAGVARLLELIRDFRQRGANPALDLLGVLVNKYDARTGISRRVHEQLVSRYGSLVFEGVIHESVELAESTDRSLPVVDGVRSRAADEIRTAANELVRRATVREGFFGVSRVDASAPPLRVVLGPGGRD